MKQISFVCIFLAILSLSHAAVEGLTADQISDIQASPKLWLIYQTKGISSAKSRSGKLQNYNS